MTGTRSLNARQRRFVEAYLATLNAEEAYRRAGYASSGWRGMPKRMFGLPAVRTAIEEGLADATRAIEIDAQRIIRRYTAIAFASIGDFVTVGRQGALGIDPSSIDAASLPALTTFDVSEYRTSKKKGRERVRRVRIGIASKLQALGALARHLGLFTAKHAGLQTPASTEDIEVAARPLEARRARFVDEYLRCGNATQAYIRAGHKPAHAHHHAWRLMARPEIRVAIEAGQRRLARRFDVSAERVIAEYVKIGFADISNYVDIKPDGSARLDLSLASREHLAALREIVVEEYCDRPPKDPHRIRRARLTLASKQHALDALARHLGLFDGGRRHAERRDEPFFPQDAEAPRTA